VKLLKPSPSILVALAALVVAAGGVAVAAIPGSDGTIQGCVKTANGDLRVVDSANDCRASERSLEWNREGPPGPPGLTTAAAEEAAEVSTGSRSFVDLGGPSVQATVPSHGLVAAVVRAEVHGTWRAPGPGDTFAAILGGCIGLFVDSQPVGGQPEESQANNLGECERGNATSGGPPFVFTYKRIFIDWFTFEAPPGRHTFSLRYRARCLIASRGCPAEDQAFYRNRKLWVTPVG
jgi:hypothetical protein